MPGRDLTNHVIIITGASSGIGAATAVECAKAGMDVVLNARREDRLREVAIQIESLGRKAITIAGDVTDPGISDRMLDAAMQTFGRFDAVFANAGYGIDRSMHAISVQEFRAIFEVNFFAAVELLQKAARRLIEAKRPGHLLMCSSCLAKFTLPNSGPYCATKAAQNHICRAMRMELKPYQIEVASVHPIGTETEFFKASAERSGRVVDNAKLVRRSPRMFMQPPERVARAVVKCLRKPRPEVWTSFPIRFMSAAMTLWPPLMDVMMGRAVKTIDKLAK